MFTKLTQIKIFLLICLTCACQNNISTRTQNNEFPRKFDTASIIADLVTKAKSFDSYAQDYVLQGHAVKRMSFLFKKNGKDFYCYRSDYFENGKKYSRLFGVDGKYDYEYSPTDKVAIRRPTQMQWNETNYPNAKDWHFNFDGYEVVGEKQVSGKDCYIMESKDFVITVWKENGMKTSLVSKNNDQPPLEYDNFAFNLSEDEFSIPEDTKIKE